MICIFFFYLAPYCTHEMIRLVVSPSVCLSSRLYTKTQSPFYNINSNCVRSSTHNAILGFFFHFARLYLSYLRLLFHQRYEIFNFTKQ